MRLKLVRNAFLFVAYLSSPHVNANLRIATYNVENLWDGDPNNTSNQPGLQYGDYSKDGSNWYDPQILDAKLNQIMHVLKVAKYPDIIALQELESAGNNSKVFDIKNLQNQTLKELLQEQGYQTFIVSAQDSNEPTSVTPGFISKFPLKTLPSIDIKFNENSTSARDIAVTEAKISNSRLIIINAHFKSKSTPTSEEERIYQAHEVNKRIESEKSKDPMTRFIVLGDLNSAYTELPLETLKAKTEKSEMYQESSDKLYNLWMELALSDRWETSWNGKKGTLSHILLSDTFFLNQGLVYLNSGFEVIGHKPNENSLLSADGTPFRWQIINEKKYSRHIGKGFSDHLMLVASFETLPETNRPAEKRDEATDGNETQTSRDGVDDGLNNAIKCDRKSFVSINQILSKHEDLFNRCITINFSKGEESELKTFGKYKQNYIELKDGTHLFLTPNRRFDFRPNKDDSRVDLQDVIQLDPKYNEKNPHPLSPKCVYQKIFAGNGGKLKNAVGRVHYQDGQLSLFIESYENQNIVLSDLPAHKLKACKTGF